MPPGDGHSFVGKVVSTAMMKTVMVAIDRMKYFPKYRHYLRRTRKFMAHDETERCNLGDIVKIHVCKQKSKRKHFDVVEIIKKDPSFDQPKYAEKARQLFASRSSQNLHAQQNTRGFAASGA